MCIHQSASEACLKILILMMWYFILKYTVRYVVIIQERHKTHSNPLASLRLYGAFIVWFFLTKNFINVLVEPEIISEPKKWKTIKQKRGQTSESKDFLGILPLGKARSNLSFYTNFKQNPNLCPE